ncbi:MAG TPA: ATP-binding protein [Dehalococcoidia bacterium]|nr:ATP-binding protein [Dehalococcoidia bacterium]
MNLEAPFRAQPSSIEDTGVSFGQMLDLAVKTIYYGGRPSARDITKAMALPFNLVDQLLSFLKREQFIEVVGSGGLGEQEYQYALSERGTERAMEALERNAYVGPTPVPFEEYVNVTMEQSVRQIRVDADVVDNALHDLILNTTTRDLVGPAVNSGRSMLLYGDPGNGKSSIAKGIGRMLKGNVLIPHAVDVSGQTIRVFDPRVHFPVDTALEEEEAEEERRAAGGYASQRPERRRDNRWVVAKRPLIITGGELTLADLELKFSPASKFYIAPVQMKANSGILVIDDFGRQLVAPKELLNRWIVPMEARVDHLSLLSGETIEIPFELLLVFSTNIPPQQLGDEAFFRRIRHKIEVGDPDEEAFLKIMKLVCEANDVPYEEAAGHYIIERYYRPKNRHLRGVHPRDIIDLLIDISSFQKREAECSREMIDLACASYFIDDREEYEQQNRARLANDGGGPVAKAS